jgi:hypothetical protein
MNDIQKRFLLFLFACIPARLAIAYAAYKVPINWLPLLGYIVLMIGLSMLYIFLTGVRKTGAETFGKPIWWNYIRPVHVVLYFLFAYNAIQHNRIAYKYMVYDVILGLLAFFGFHYSEGNFTKLF